MIWALLFGIGAAAAASGPDRVEVLGFEPVDGKVYALHHAGGGAAPQLRFFALNSAEPRRLYRARGGPSSAQLKPRLEPLKLAPLLGAELRLRWRDHRVCAVAPTQPKTHEEIRALIAAFERGEAQDPAYPVCLAQDVTLRWAGYLGRGFIETWGDVKLTGLWRLPDARFALGRIRHLSGAGSAEDQLIVLRREAPAEPDLPALERACDRWREAAPQIESPEIIRPGVWRPALAPSFVDQGAWARAKSRRFVVDHVDHTLVIVHRHGSAVIALGRAHGGGVCVVAVQEEVFGGNGVEITLSDMKVEEARATLVFKHQREYRGGDWERGWSILRVEGAAPRWLARGARLEVDEIRISGAGFMGIKGGAGRPVEIKDGRLSLREGAGR